MKQLYLRNVGNRALILLAPPFLQCLQHKRSIKYVSSANSAVDYIEGIINLIIQIGVLKKTEINLPNYTKSILNIKFFVK